MVKRIEKISSALGCCEAALFTSDTARRYLTGFGSSAGAVVVTADSAYFFIDFRYIEMAQKTVTSCKTVLMKRFGEQLPEFLRENGIKKLFVETSRISVDEFFAWKKRLGDIEVTDSDRIDTLLGDMRSVKDTAEIESITQAQKITDMGFAHILDFIKVGRTEREIALELEFFMRKLGSEGTAFDFIAVSGENSSLPHGVPTDRKIRSGDFITLDFGAVVNGYRSDMTRTVAVGDVSKEQKKVYDTVLRAQVSALEFLKAGVLGCDADKVARDIITNAGYGDCFGHSLGHSVGIEIHESPNCSPTCKTPLLCGTIMTVEPGIYIAGKFGVRIEDMVIIEENGIHNFTQSPKELIVL